MPDVDGPLVFGWRACAARARVSERYVRQLARDRGLVVDRRGDGAVGIAAAALDELAAELGSGSKAASPNNPAGVGAPPPLNGSAPASQRLPEDAAKEHATSAPQPVPSTATGSSTPASLTEDGPLAAAVFRELACGRSLREIVVALEVAPEVVREMHRRWKRSKQPTP